jgi:hypothetical protein
VHLRPLSIPEPGGMLISPGRRVFRRPTRPHRPCLVAGLRPTHQAGGHGPAGAVWRASTVRPEREGLPGTSPAWRRSVLCGASRLCRCKVRRCWSAAARLRQLREDRHRRRKLRAAQRHEAAAQAAVRQLGGELAVLVPSCLLPSRPSFCSGGIRSHRAMLHSMGWRSTSPRSPGGDQEGVATDHRLVVRGDTGGAGGRDRVQLNR